MTDLGYKGVDPYPFYLFTQKDLALTFSGCGFERWSACSSFNFTSIQGNWTRSKCCNIFWMSSPQKVETNKKLYNHFDTGFFEKIIFIASSICTLLVTTHYIICPHPLFSYKVTILISTSGTEYGGKQK